MKFLRTIFILPLLIACLLMTGCGPTIRDTAKTAHRAAKSLRAARDLKVSLLQNEVISKEESDDLTRLMQDALSTVRSVNDRAAEWQAKLDALDPHASDYAQRAKAIEEEGSRDLRPLVQAALKSLRELNDKGVLHIKNKEARESLSALLDLGELFT